MGKKSKTKGNSYELKIAKAIIDRFIPCVDPTQARQLVHRTPMSGGHVERGDLICKTPILKYFPWFVECRNRENWTWKQIWEQGDDSMVIGTWFVEDAHEKCHPYDHSEDTANHRYPMLLFTQNFRKSYFAVAEHDLYDVFPEWQDQGRSISDMLSPTPIMRVYVDKQAFEGYVVIGDFDKLLALHPAAHPSKVQFEIDCYCGVHLPEDSDETTDPS